MYNMITYGWLATYGPPWYDGACTKQMLQ